MAWPDYDVSAVYSKLVGGAGVSGLGSFRKSKELGELLGSRPSCIFTYEDCS